MKPEVAVGGHCRASGLERPPAAAVDRHPLIIDRVPEHRFGETPFVTGERATLPSGDARVRRAVHPPCLPPLRPPMRCCRPPASGRAAPCRRASPSGPAQTASQDRKSDVEGKSVSVRVDRGGRSNIKKKKKKT